jgi:UDP-N-acetyl-D-glucosamine dehydrogenase
LDADTLEKQRVLKDKIDSHAAKIGILGLGYVGLPLACEFAKAGYEVTGFEVDSRKVKSILARKSYIEDISTDQLKELVLKKKLTATIDFSKLAKMDVCIICVPTPLNKTKDPDVSFIAESARQIAKHLHKNQLIVLESTTYPGTTRDFVLPILEAQGMKAGKDFYIAFSPERIDPGNKHYHLANTPKVVGGITPLCGELTALLYGQIVQRVIPVSCPESAELVKLLENTFRAVNIGLVNEMALICDKLGLNVWEVIDAASSKPYGFMPFYPGPGLGGHCIPIDPHYLSWKMKSLNFSARFIELAGEVNSHMPEFVLEKVTRALNDRKKAVKGSKILVLGIAYKANVSDMRESPALDLLHLLNEQGGHVAYHDPYVPSVTIGDLHLKSKPYSAKQLKHYDAVVITTAHAIFKPQEILHHSKLVIDTRNMMRGLSANHLVRL